jgi:hypothetical protein
MPRRSSRTKETTKNESNDEETDGRIPQEASVKKENGTEEGEGTVGLVPYELQRLEL